EVCGGGGNEVFDAGWLGGQTQAPRSGGAARRPFGKKLLAVAVGGGGSGSSPWRGEPELRLDRAVQEQGATGNRPPQPGQTGGSLVAGLGKAFSFMLSFSGSLKVLLAVEPCDLRKSFNGLHGLATERLGEDPRQGTLFVFTNRRRTRLKMLCWDGTGLWVLTKRLEQGTFSWPRNVEPGRAKLALTPQALALLTDGVDLRGGKLRPWYERE